MPEFEEENNLNEAPTSYTPRSPSKNRSRRRNGGFKDDNTLGSIPSQIGEINPEDIGEFKTTPNKKEETNKAAVETDSNILNTSEISEPKVRIPTLPMSQETLRVIQDLEEKITEKKQSRISRNLKKRSKEKKRKGVLSSLINFIKKIFKKNGKKYTRKNSRPNNRPTNKRKGRPNYRRRRN